MTEVLIAGIGQTPVGEHWDTSLRELAFHAIEMAQEDAGGIKAQALFVGNMLAPMLSGQAHLGALIADFIGMRGIEAYTTEAAGASGGATCRRQRRRPARPGRSADRASAGRPGVGHDPDREAGEAGAQADQDAGQGQGGIGPAEEAAGGHRGRAAHQLRR